MIASLLLALLTGPALAGAPALAPPTGPIRAIQKTPVQIPKWLLDDPSQANVTACKVAVHVDPDGVPRNTTAVPDSCSGDVTDYLGQQLLGWRFTARPGQGGLVTTVVTVSISPPPSKRADMGRYLGQTAIMEQLGLLHDIVPDDAAACRVRVLLDRAGRPLTRQTNRQPCLIAVGQPAPPPVDAFNDQGSLVCAFRFSTIHGRAGKLDLVDCPETAQDWALDVATAIGFPAHRDADPRLVEMSLEATTLHSALPGQSVRQAP